MGIPNTAKGKVFQPITKTGGPPAKTGKVPANADRTESREIHKVKGAADHCGCDNPPQGSKKSGGKTNAGTPPLNR